MMNESLTFVVSVALLLATPGPTNTLLLTAGATSGPRSLRLIPAEISGYLISILTIGYVIAPLLATFHMIAVVLRLIVAGYLAVLAIKLWQHAPSIAVDQRLIRFRDVFVTTLLNPKALLFALGIVPLRNAAVAWYLLAFCLLVAVIGSLWICLGLAIARGFVSESRKSVLPRMGAAVIAGFASYLVILQFL
jgi:threonine/homoserine/homoserine lactone efflux protein